MLDNATIEAIKESPAANQWEKVGMKHHHGICLPLFSLHSNQSCGIGEFTDLLKLIPWCQEVGMNVIQLLPLNDTGKDTSPYNALTANALNPLHLGFRHDCPLKFSKRVDYKKVAEIKMKWLRDSFRENGETIVNSDLFQQFLIDHPWLQAYAVFKALKIQHNWDDWRIWGPPYNHPTEEIVLNYEPKEEVLFHQYVQFLCFQQLHKVKEVANQHGILLKGDIPILISPDSEEVWLHQNLFDLSVSAGAPPDMYNKDGQIWGFPLFNWEKMKANGYQWWRTRLNTASQLYDIYRIDHIVGFFRIWAVPHGNIATDGHYVPKDRAHWFREGRERLAMMLHSNNMLPIGEDLGTVPDKVHRTLEEMGICGTKFLMSLKVRKTLNTPYEFTPFSLTTVSTHDSPTLDLWWRDYPEEVQVYAKIKNWKIGPTFTQEQRIDILHESHHSSSLFHINLLQEYLALFPELTWENIDDERINHPGIISDKNWNIRHRVPVEEIVAHEGLKKIIKHDILAT